MIRALGLALALLLAVPASAQTSRAVTIQLVNFQDDRREPISPAQALASFAANADPNSVTFGNLLREGTNGLATMTVTVSPAYITLPENKSCAPSATTARSMAVQAGYPINGIFWLYSPTTFGGCQELDRMGYYVAGSLTSINLPFHASQMFGAGGISWQFTCKDAAGAWVTLSSNCNTNGLRHFRDPMGQAWGFYNPQSRKLMGTLPASRVVSVTPSSTAQRFTLASMNGGAPPPAGALQEIVVRNCRTMDGSEDVSLSYYTFNSTFRDTVFNHDGLTLHVANSSLLLDAAPMPPDGETRAGYASAHTLKAGTSYTCPTGTRITAGAITASGIGVTIDQGSTEPLPPPPPPPPPSCTPTPQPAVNVQNLIAPDCAVWVVDGAPNYAVRRNGANTGADAFNLSMCSGVLYARSRSGQFYEWTGTGWRGRTTANPCGSTPTPPPSDPCVVSPLVPVVSITAAGHTLRWPSFIVTDERNCTATVPAKP